MPNITKRTNKDGSASFRIRVFVGADSNGKQLYKSKTWTPPAGMRPTTAEKEAAKMAALYEDQVQHGLVAYDGATKFGEYAQKWVENAQIAPKTRENYEFLLKRTQDTIGHIKLENLQAHHLEAFYRNLAEGGINQAENYTVSKKLKALLKQRKESATALSKIAKLDASTVQAAARGEHVSIQSAKRICTALGVGLTDVFEVHGSSKGLSENSILHYHRFISAVLSKAKKERLVPFNVASEHTTPPKLPHKESSYLDDKEAQRFLSIVLTETDIRTKAAFILLLFSGIRKGELCGLTWNDIDEEKQVIHIKRASQYLVKQGIVQVPTKNLYSIRTVKVPPIVLDILTEYRAWWNRQRLIFGKDWQGNTETLFIRENGLPINPGTVNNWLRRIIKENDLPHITPHSLRHTFATLQIAAGVDIRTLQARTGHAQASTLMNVYSHAIKSAQESASEALENMLLPKAK